MLVSYGNGNGVQCPLSPEAVDTITHLDGNINRLELAIRDNTLAMRDGFSNLGSELRLLRGDLLSAATNRDFVHKDIVKLLLVGLLILDAIIVIWFTGIAPMLSGDGVSFKKMEASSDWFQPPRGAVCVTTAIRGTGFNPYSR